jgi:hypothetical protein
MKPKFRDLSWKGIERSLKRFTTGARRGSTLKALASKDHINLDMTGGVKVSK